VLSILDLIRDGQFITRLTASDGQVTLDRTAQFFGRLEATVQVATTDLPTRSNGRLVPSGWEVMTYTGLVLPNGTHAVVPVGVFALETTSVSKTGAATIMGWDRSSVVAADLLTAPLDWPGPFASIEAAVEDLVRRTYPSIRTNFGGVGNTCPTITHPVDSSPWSIIMAAATSVGRFAFFNEWGEFEWEPEPDVSSVEPIASFGPGAGLVDIKAQVTAQDVYNSWTVVGTNPALGTEVTSTVFDSDPSSPTRWGGPMKRRPRRSERLNLVDTQAKADAAALAMRAAQIGFGVHLDLDIVPHYAVEPGDVIYVSCPSAGVDGPAVVDGQTIQLGTGAMKLACRARQVAV
jgi:hypothetical protein